VKYVVSAFVLGALIIQAQEYTSEQPPVVIRRCTALYTEEARRAKLEGTVVLYIEINPDGLARSIKVTRSLGMGLDESAVDAVKHWRWKAGQKHGEAVTTPATFEVNFRLNDPSPTCPTEPREGERKP
jgi:TonB family protein